jgi:hypothetical protein
MQVRTDPLMRRGEFFAIVEQGGKFGFDGIWHYVIKSETAGDEIYDGWAPNLDEALQTAELHLDYLCQQSGAFLRLGRYGR